VTRVQVTAPAVNASTALSVPTYVASNEEAVHPDIVDAGSAWNGYRYWMAFTPYPASDSADENPSIVASNDGRTWVEPTGITNPVEAQPAGSGEYNSDTDLVLHDGTLFLFWRAYLPSSGAGQEERIRYRTSIDGVSWSASTDLIVNDATVRRLVSPSVVQESDGTWSMWAVDIVPATNVVVRLTADDLTGPWSSPAAVTGATEPGRDPWHVDVVRDGSTYRMLLNTVDLGTSGTGGRLLLGSSADGDAWTMLGWPVMTARTGAWDSSFVYRASGLMRGDGGIDVWYSAKGSLWGIGRTVIPNGTVALATP